MKKPIYLDVETAAMVFLLCEEEQSGIVRKGPKNEMPKGKAAERFAGLEAMKDAILEAYTGRQLEEASRR